MKTQRIDFLFSAGFINWRVTYVENARHWLIYKNGISICKVEETRLRQFKNETRAKRMIKLAKEFEKKNQ